MFSTMMFYYPPCISRKGCAGAFITLRAFLPFVKVLQQEDSSQWASCSKVVVSRAVIEKHVNHLLYTSREIYIGNLPLR